MLEAETEGQEIVGEIVTDLPGNQLERPAEILSTSHERLKGSWLVDTAHRLTELAMSDDKEGVKALIDESVDSEIRDTWGSLSAETQPTLAEVNKIGAKAAETRAKVMRDLDFAARMGDGLLLADRDTELASFYARNGRMETRGPLQRFYEWTTEYKPQPLAQASEVLEDEKRFYDMGMPSFSEDDSHIAHTIGGISGETTMYMGPLVPGLLQKLRDAHVAFIQVPGTEVPIRIQSVSIGGTSKDDLLAQLKDAGADISGAEEILTRSEFETLPDKREVDVVRLSVEQLDIEGAPTLEAVLERAQALQLELCADEMALQYLLQQQRNEQPIGMLDNSVTIGMQPIDNDDHSRTVLNVSTDRSFINKSQIDTAINAYNYGGRENYCGPQQQFLFVIPKSLQSEP